MTQDSAQEGSGVHDAHHFGFWIADEAPDEAAFLPPERRPLTLRKIRSWTIGSLVGSMVVLGLILASVLSSSHTREPGKAQAAARIDSVPAETVGAPAAQPPKVGIPLESLPRVSDGAEGASSPSHVQRAEPSKSRSRVKPSSVKLSTAKREPHEFRPAGI